MPEEELSQLEVQLHRFNRLVADLMHGATARNTFLPWEIAILLDLEDCQVERRRRIEILRQYQRAVGRQMEHGPGPPMKLSEFLTMRALRRPAKTPPCASVDSRLAS